MPQINVKVGDRVRVWPAFGARVRERPELPRPLPADGKEVAWSAWLESKLASGEVYLSDPAPQAPAKPGSAPAKAGSSPAKE